MDRRAYVDLPRLFKTEDSWKKEILPNEEAIIPVAEIPEANADGDTGIENSRQNEDKLMDLGLQEVIQSLPRDQRNQDLFGGYLVDRLRSQLNLPYDDCVGAALIVMQELIQYMQNANHCHLDIDTVMRLQDQTSSSQEEMSRSQARDSWDFKNAVAQIDGLEDYRKGAGNREKCWPGGTFPANADEEDGPSELCPASAISALQNAFKRANPQVLYHVIEYPGENSPDEFKLIELLADEFQWLLQTSESSPANLTNSFLQNLCGILQNSIEMHSQALKVAARNSTMRSVIFRILRKLIHFQKIDSKINSSQILINLMKISTAILSVLHNDAELAGELENEVSIDEIFFELTACLQELVGLASHPQTVGQLKEQLVALLTAVSGFSHRCDESSVVESRDSVVDSDRLGLFFCNLWNGVTAPGKDELAQYLGQTVLEWWNYHGVGTSGRMNLEAKFGLKDACGPVASFLADLVSVNVRTNVNEFDSTSSSVYFPVLHTSDSLSVASSDEFYLIGDGDCELVVGMCRRMCEDFDPEDKLYTIAESLEKVIVSTRLKNA